MWGLAVARPGTIPDFSTRARRFRETVRGFWRGASPPPVTEHIQHRAPDILLRYDTFVRTGREQSENKTVYPRRAPFRDRLPPLTPGTGTASRAVSQDPIGRRCSRCQPHDA
ncbi:hypothetical protein AAFF_G00101010 [Aldrovandia affinis]|uniref:Uncharacterized protein n=1 Tax=Aldrovandia affinis TaxID=143900 RepID=A0AAD7RUN2_9TELE|nr:hypothetical protein AAFF_G00101010 [Aldrovandia affinis]